MKTHKAILILALFFSFLSTHAQDKYEFMIIEFTTYKDFITVSIDGKEFIKEKVDYADQDKSGYNANPLLLKVKNYQEQGWELMNFNITMAGINEMYFASMRRKKNR